MQQACHPVLSLSRSIISEIPKIYLDMDGTLMLTWRLIVGHHPRRIAQYQANTLSNSLLYPLSSNSFPHNVLSDPHPLSPVVSIFYETIGGGVCFHSVDRHG